MGFGCEEILCEYKEITIGENVAPSINQCVGEGKLLGDKYAAALCEIFRVDNKNTLKQLTELSVSMRSFIVINDYCKDSKISEQLKKKLRNIMQRLERHIKKLITEIQKDEKEIWEHFLFCYEDAYINYFYYHPFIAIIRKCSMLFLPFELDIISKNKKREVMIETIEDYLFSLQLLDDFQDMEEDNVSPKNQNIFTSRMPESLKYKLTRNKYCIIISLLRYIMANLSASYNILKKHSISEETIISKYFNGSILWLNSKIEKYSDMPNIEIFYGKYREYNIDINALLVLEELSYKEEEIDFSDIRAEEMHVSCI